MKDRWGHCFVKLVKFLTTIIMYNITPFEVAQKYERSTKRNMQTDLKQILSQTQRRDKSGNMLSFNPLQLLTLVLMLSLCMANPVNRSADKEDELVINKDLTRTNKSEVPDTGMDDGGKPADTSRGAIDLKEEKTEQKKEQSKKKASWETAKYIFISWS